MYAIIETGGKQISVKVGDLIFVEKLDNEVETEVTFDKVVFVGGENSIVGAPYVEGGKVTGIVKKHGKGEKVIVFRYRNKHNINVKNGHRQPYTRVEITDIKV